MARKSRPVDPVLEARIGVVVGLRLDGAETWDVRQYVAEKEKAGEPPWKLNEGETPLSERTIRRYVAQADARVSASCRTTRRADIKRHKAQRRSLYARSVAAGDYRAALQVLDSLAKLADLFPAAKIKTEHSGAVGVRLQIVEEIVNDADQPADEGAQPVDAGPQAHPPDHPPG